MWNVYRCDRISRGQAPQNEVEFETGFATAGEAMDRASELRRTDPRHSYTVGGD